MFRKSPGRKRKVFRLTSSSASLFESSDIGHLFETRLKEDWLLNGLSDSDLETAVSRPHLRGEGASRPIYLRACNENGGAPALLRIENRSIPPIATAGGLHEATQSRPLEWKMV